MTQQEKKILNQYASAKVQEKKAKNIINELKDSVISILVKYTGGESGDKLKIDEGSFSINKKRSYVYPDYVNVGEKELKEEIKALKTKSEQIKDGEYTENIILTFKQS